MRAFEGGDFGVQSSNCGVQSWNGQTHKVSAAQHFVRDSSWFFSQTPKTNPDPWKFLKYTNACCSPLFDWAYMPELQKKYRRNSMRNSTDHGRWVTECGWRWQVVSCAESLRPGRIFSSSRRTKHEFAKKNTGVSRTSCQGQFVWPAKDLWFEYFPRGYKFLEGLISRHGWNIHHFEGMYQQNRRLSSCHEHPKKDIQCHPEWKRFILPRLFRDVCA